MEPDEPQSTPQPTRRLFVAATLAWLTDGLWQATVRAAPPPPRAERSLLDEDVARSYLGQAWQTIEGWAELPTPPERATALFQAVNLALRLAAMPGLEHVVVRPLQSPIATEFHSGNWQLRCDPRPLEPASLTREEGVQLVALFYHEARHAQQFWLMGRWLAGAGLRTGAAIRRHLLLDEGVADIAAHRPLPPQTSIGRQAKQWFDNLAQDFNQSRRKLQAAWQQANPLAPNVPGPGPGPRAAPTSGSDERYRQATLRYQSQTLEQDADRARDLIITLARQEILR